VAFHTIRHHDPRRFLATGSQLLGMSFENAPVSKGGVRDCKTSLARDCSGLLIRASGLMLWLAVATVLSGIFDIKYYFHLQVRPTRSAR